MHTYNGIQNWFWRSETILWARLQVAFGIVWGVVSLADLSPVLDSKWLMYWLIFNGIVSEALRRYRSTERTIVVPVVTDGTLEPVTKSFLVSPTPGP